MRERRGYGIRSCRYSSVLVFRIPGLTYCRRRWDSPPPVCSFGMRPCLFLSGLFFPAPAASILERMARVLPTYHFHQAVFATFAPAAGARVIDTGALAIMLAWGVAGLAVAAWRFRWEPRQRP